MKNKQNWTWAHKWPWTSMSNYCSQLEFDIIHCNFVTNGYVFRLATRPPRRPNSLWLTLTIKAKLLILVKILLEMDRFVKRKNTFENNTNISISPSLTLTFIWLWPSRSKVEPDPRLRWLLFFSKDDDMSEYCQDWVQVIVRNN